MSARIFNDYMRNCIRIGHEPSVDEVKLYEFMTSKYTYIKF